MGALPGPFSEQYTRARARVPCASSVWLSASLGGSRHTSLMVIDDDLDPAFIDAYRVACDDLGVDPLPVPDLVQLLAALLGAVQNRPN